jgi:hypothetical protein
MLDEINYDFDVEEIITEDIIQSEDDMLLEEDKSNFRNYLLGKYGKSAHDMLKDVATAAVLHKELESYMPQAKFLNSKPNVKDAVFEHNYLVYATYLDYVGVGAKKNMSFENMLRGMSHYLGGKLSIKIGNGKVEFVTADRSYTSSEMIEYATNVFSRSDIELSVDQDSIDVYQMQFKKVKQAVFMKSDTTIKTYLTHGPISLSKYDFDSIFPDIMRLFFSSTQETYVPGFKLSRTTNLKKFSMLTVPSARCNSHDINYPFSGLWTQESMSSRINRLMSYMDCTVDSPYYKQVFEDIITISSTSVELMKTNYHEYNDSQFVPFHNGWFHTSKSDTYEDGQLLVQRQADFMANHAEKGLVYFPIGTVSYWMCGTRKSKKQPWSFKILIDVVKYIKRIFDFLRHMSMFNLIDSDSVFDFEYIGNRICSSILTHIGRTSVSYSVHEVVRANLIFWLKTYELTIPGKGKYSPPAITIYGDDNIIMEYDPDLASGFGSLDYSQWQNDNDYDRFEDDKKAENDEGNNDSL